LDRYLSKISKQQVLPCAAGQKLSSDMVSYDVGTSWTPLDQWTIDADVAEDLDWLFGTQHSKIARLSISMVDNPPSHSLYIGLPVMIIHMAIMKKMKRIKTGFWTFLLGTHHKLGGSSPVRKISGLSPVIRQLYQFCHFQPEVDHAISVIENHLVQMMKICRLRSLLMDIVDEKKQSMWTMNACTVCQQGGDCEKGVFKSNDATNELIEKKLRRGDPDTFSILEHSIHKALGWNYATPTDIQIF
jgi:hypothetical protein